MARPLRIQFPGAFYHVMCRGNHKQRIFHTDADRNKFISLLIESLEIYSVRLHAYVLMDNHYHLLVQTMKANCGEFMRRFNVSYTGWFNYQHGRCGHLYQGRYKALVIEAESYLLEVSRYLHLNNVRPPYFSATGFHRRWLHASSYRWSSLPGYINKKRTTRFVYYEQILSMVEGRRPYTRFIIDGIKMDTGNPFKDVRYGLLLGDDSFVKKMRAECIEEGSKQEQPSYRELVVEHVEPQRVIECVADVYGVEESVILDFYGDSELRGIVSELLYRYSDLTQAKIGKMIGGLSYSGVSKLRSRLHTKLASNHTIAAKYKEVEKRVKELSIVKI